MKSLIVLAVVLFSFNTHSAGQGKAATKFFPKGTQAHDAKVVVKKDEAPCADPKEDLLKKMEEKKKIQAAAGKGFSLQGATDTGCSIK